LALTQRSAKESFDDPQDDVVSTLIRETQAACAAKDAESARRLDEIARQLHEHLERRQQEAEARRALLAL
jgi:ribosomal protein S15P/S13E